VPFWRDPGVDAGGIQLIATGDEIEARRRELLDEGAQT
jgi:hypothetical protein